MINRKLEALRQLETIGRTRFRAQVTEHTSGCVEDEGRQHSLLVHLLALAHFPAQRPDLDASDRAGKRAKIARDAKSRAVFRIEIEPGRAAKPFGHSRG